MRLVVIPLLFVWLVLSQGLSNLFVLHIAKTGGTSLGLSLKNAKFNTTLRGSLQKVRTTCHPTESKKITNAYTLEVTYNTAVSSMSAECVNQTLFFSMIRHPSTWIRSAYSHTCRIHPEDTKQLCASGQVMDLIEAKSHYFRQTPFQTSFVDDLITSPHPYILCRFECYQKCLNVLSRVLGQPLKLFKQNVKPRSDHRLKTSEAELQRIVGQYYAEDLALYNSFGKSCFRASPEFEIYIP